MSSIGGGDLRERCSKAQGFAVKFGPKGNANTKLIGKVTSSNREIEAG